jgi:lysyl-tRNA synthetase class 2
MREDILQTKLDKLNNIREFGMDAYPEKTMRDMTNLEALEVFDELGEKEITLVGRVRSFRPMGGSTFAHIEDGTDRIQIFLNKNNIPEDKYRLFAKNVELGDFVQVTGKLFKTKQDEKTLEVHEWSILTKNIRPIPTEHFGIKDEEEKLRKRYLDLMINFGRLCGIL